MADHCVSGCCEEPLSPLPRNPEGLRYAKHMATRPYREPPAQEAGWFGVPDHLIPPAADHVTTIYSDGSWILHALDDCECQPPVRSQWEDADGNGFTVNQATKPRYRRIADE